MSYPLLFSMNAGPAKTGLSMRAQLLNEDLTDYASEVSTGFTEEGQGWYAWAGDIPDGFQGYLRIRDSGHTLKFLWGINPAETEYPALIKDKTDQLGNARVTVVSPVAGDLKVEVVAGDDYLDVDGRALRWSDSDTTNWPDLTGASVVFTARKGAHRLPKTLTVEDGDTVSMELTAAETGPLTIGYWDYSIVATLTDSSVVTLVLAKMLVREGVS